MPPRPPLAGFGPAHLSSPELQQPPGLWPSPCHVSSAERFKCFYQWRKSLQIAIKEEEIAAVAFKHQGGGVKGASVTPYEKNLHVWRQLWRVLERSSIVLRIVNARTLLFYLSDDLRRYAMEEFGKPMLMIVNKADYLTEVQQQKKIDEAVVVGRQRRDFFEDEDHEQK
eukprot:scaffold112727_cov55-Cyclotella_meneghiniana.AAC.1